MRLLITGSQGLVGTKFLSACRGRGHEAIPFDIIRPEAENREDLCDTATITSLAQGCDGIVHLAAVSRVAWGEARPDLCQRTNVDGTRSVLDAALSARGASGLHPWLLFTSSREVYGNPFRDLQREDDPIAPLNVYGRSKAAGEHLVNKAREAGLATSILRLSNVYGGRRDHPDRAIPALLSNALAGRDLTLTGGGNYFDFVHVDDCVDGLFRTIDLLAGRETDLPPIHLTTGIATSLRELAEQAIETAGSASRIVETDPRAFDVSGFCGSPDRAASLLGWRAMIDLREGLTDVAGDLSKNGPLDPVEIPDPDSWHPPEGAVR